MADALILLIGFAARAAPTASTVKSNPNSSDSSADAETGSSVSPIELAYLSETCCLCGGSGKRKHRLGHLEHARGSNFKMQLQNRLTKMYHWDQVVHQIVLDLLDLLLTAIIWGLLTLAVDKIIALVIVVSLLIVGKVCVSCDGKCIRCYGSGKVTWNEKKLNWIGSSSGSRGDLKIDPRENGEPFRRPVKPTTDYDKTQEEAGKAEGGQGVEK